MQFPGPTAEVVLARGLKTIARSAPLRTRNVAAAVSRPETAVICFAACASSSLPDIATTNSLAIPLTYDSFIHNTSPS
jgi:hypothetical protein